MMMKALLLLLLVVCSSLINGQLSEHDFPPAYLHLITKVRKHCLDLHPISDAERETARNGIFHDDDTEMKKYVTCLFTKSGFTDKSLHMNEALLNAFMPKDLKEGNGVKMIIGCSEKARQEYADHPLEDKVWDLLKCMYHEDPVVSDSNLGVSLALALFTEDHIDHPVRHCQHFDQIYLNNTVQVLITG